MRRTLAAAALLLAACSGGDAAATSTTTTSTPPPPALAPGAVRFGDPSVPVVLEIPPLWRVATPRAGTAAVFYAPSDNNLVAERVTVGLADDQGEFTVTAVAELAATALASEYGPGSILATSTDTVGSDERPAEVIEFRWETSREEGTATQWLVEAGGQFVALTFYVDPAEPELYRPAVDRLLTTAVFEP
jgi:hypothetical protein